MERTRPEKINVAPMRYNVIANLRCSNDVFGHTHDAQRMFAEVSVPKL